MYIVCYCDYEGIGAIFAAGDEPDAARDKVLSIREQIRANKKKRRSTRYRLPSPWSSMDDPDRICVRVAGEGEVFECCCAALDVAPSKRVFM